MIMNGIKAHSDSNDIEPAPVIEYFIMLITKSHRVSILTPTINEMTRVMMKMIDQPIAIHNCINGDGSISVSSSRSFFRSECFI